MCWAELKRSVRDQNTTFKLKDVEKLTWNWLNNCDSIFISNCIDHVQGYEENFKKADQQIEQIESELNDEDNIDTDSDMIKDGDEDRQLQIISKSFLIFVVRVLLILPFYAQYRMFLDGTDQFDQHHTLKDTKSKLLLVTNCEMEHNEIPIS